MPNIKRTTKKTGNGSRRTTTLSSTGTKTESYSNRPTKQSPRRTVSFNHKTGRTRTTYSQKLGGGWTRINTKTTGTKKTKNYRGSVKVNSGDLAIFLSIPLLFVVGIILLTIYFIPASAPYIVIGILSIVFVYFILKLLIFLIPYVILGSFVIGLLYLLSLMI